MTLFYQSLIKGLDRINNLAVNSYLPGLCPGCSILAEFDPEEERKDSKHNETDAYHQYHPRG
jgi:hypothetical protein